jgi:hypothetical protein
VCLSTLYFRVLFSLQFWTVKTYNFVNDLFIIIIIITIIIIIIIIIIITRLCAGPSGRAV